MVQLKTEDFIKYENDLMSTEEVTRFFQMLIDSGMAWTLQGHYGRTADSLLRAGFCKYPKTDEE